MGDVRDKMQSQVVRDYIMADTLHSSIIAPTGSGKSFISMKIIKAYEANNVLILVNSENLRDRNWAEEFKKFGLEEFYQNNVKTDTYQSAHRWDSGKFEDFDFILLDEVDFIAETNKYSKVLTKLKCRVLGVTGFVDPKRRDWFRTNLPIIHETKAKEMQEQGQLNKVKYVFHKFELSRLKNREVVYKDKKTGAEKKFYTSDNEAYAHACRKFDVVIQQKKKLNEEFAAGMISPDEYQDKLVKAEARIQYAMNNRNRVLLTNEGSIRQAKAVIKSIRARDRKAKIVVFSVYTEQSDKLGYPVYNGKLSKEDNSEILSNFIGSSIKTLAVCGKLDRGTNIPKLKYGLFESYYGAETAANQRIGRLLRLPPDELAEAHILLPYYRKEKADGTFEQVETHMVKSARKMLKNLDTSLNELTDYTYA